MFRRRSIGWPTIAVAACALGVLLRAGGYLTPLEHEVADARSGLLKRQVESDIVIIGVDAHSLAELNQWPWPRRYHAELLALLDKTDPRQVFLDIDFSARSNPEDDAALEAAFAAWSGEPILLPALFQQASGVDGELLITLPPESLARHAKLGVVNQVPDSDGAVRRLRSSWDILAQDLPSAVSILSGAALPPQTDVPIDFSIAPESFTYISYADLLRGRVSPSQLKDKTVLVGATAVELGDMVPTPLYQSIPGVILQALAVQSVREKPLRMPPEWLYLAVLAAWAAACAAILHTRSWRKNVGALVGTFVIAAAASVYAYGMHRLVLEVVPFMICAATAFLAVTFRSLDEQTLRAFTYALGLRRRDALLRSIVDSSTDCIICIDGQGRIQTANPTASKLFGCETEMLIGAPVSRFIPELGGETTGKMLEALSSSVTEWEAQTFAGDPVPIELSLSRVQLGEEMLYTAIMRDISARKADQRQLQYQATHDPLTALPNRTALAQHLNTVLPAAGPQNPVALLMLDLCRFKEVNDTLGHNVGDFVLCEVARRFRQIISEHGFIARVGGDEFTAVLYGFAATQQIVRLCQELNESLQSPIRTDGVAVDVGVSIGIARFPKDAQDEHTLLRRADVAMYTAKRRGSPYEFYDAAHDGTSVRKLMMVSELRSAIAASGIELRYQPQIELQSGRARSVEALLRWNHPLLGEVSPAEFVNIAEMSDLVQPLTDWTLRTALRQITRWRAQGLDVRIAVNLSARILQDVDFPARLRSLLESHTADPRFLELEITESAMMADPERAMRVVREIHQLGVMIAIDDYGTGYSSLSYLRELPVHALKLDKSFIMQLQTRHDDRVIVESTVRMAHALKLKAVAEGVESEWIAHFLAGIGCDYAQGYHYSRALRAEQCLAWIQSFNSAASTDADMRVVRAATGA